jgi:hypothetical protein
VCGAVHAHQSERYRNHVCAECERRARCTHDRGVLGYNPNPLGGFAARHANRGYDECDQVTADGRVWVDGREFRMQEARFGGVVTVQLRRLLPVAQTVVWSVDQGVEWTAAGVPEAFAGYVAELAVERRWLRRTPSRWQWVVRSTTTEEVRERGVAATASEARERVVAVLDELRRDDPSLV